MWNKGQDSEEGRHAKKAAARVTTDVLMAKMRAAQVTREDIVRWMHLPFFEEIMTGMYFRWHFEPEKKKYRVMEVRDIIPWKRTYQVPGAGRKPQAVKKGFTALYGKTPYKLSFERISNSAFEEEEIRRWRAMIEQDRIREPSVTELEENAQRLVDQRAHILTAVHLLFPF